jgi:hypothetical protein
MTYWDLTTRSSTTDTALSLMFVVLWLLAVFKSSASGSQTPFSTGKLSRVAIHLLPVIYFIAIFRQN